MTDAAAPPRNGLRHALIAAMLVFAAGALGSAATMPAIPTWYAGLTKPSFTPPNWAFGPAWTTLYILMAIAFWRVLQAPPTEMRRGAIVAFVVQMALNTLWSFAFFGARAPLAGLVVIAALWAAIAVALVRCWRLDRPAGALLVPYLAWVSFASALNAAIYLLN